MSGTSAGSVVLLALAVSLALAQERLPAPTDFPVPDPAPRPPGAAYEPPVDPALEPPEGTPEIYEHSGDAGPGQSFLVVGGRLSDRLLVWGRDSARPHGRDWTATPRLASEGYMAATLPDRACDGPFLVWVGNEAGWSRPFRLNVPQPWWCWPNPALPGGELRLFGRDLARRPDRTTAFVYLVQPGSEGRWLDVLKAGKYDLTVKLPEGLPAGDYQLWCHAGFGGQYTWGDPVKLHVVQPSATPAAESSLPPGRVGDAPADLQKALDDLAAAGGGVLKLERGEYPFRGTLRVPARVTIAGVGATATRLQLIESSAADFPPTRGAGWNQSPSGVHTVGDTMSYDLEIPSAGQWHVWLRYATEMSPWNQPGVSGNMTLQVDDAQPVPLDNLPNTGSFGTYRWSLAATLDIPAGKHRLTWRNVKGGGISLDAYVFALDPDFRPSDDPFPISGERVVVLQGEDVVDFESREGSLPGRMRSAVWLQGDGASLRDLTVSGSPQVTTGVFIGAADPAGWITGCRVDGCCIADMEAKDGEIIGVHLSRARSAVVRGNEIWGRAPLFLTGVRQCDLSHNLLVPVTRYGGNSTGAITGRCDTIEECLVEGNRAGSPPGAEAGGPQTMRLIWVATGHGSITHNWFANNGVVEPNGPGAANGAGPMRFGGVAPHDQNTGEMILFEANHRTMYFGPLAAADATGVTLPATLPPTPDERLGNVAREQLAHDAAGNETPYWPPHDDTHPVEPALTEYYVSVLSGPGQGQTRRVVRREGERLLIERPWRTPPTADSVVTVGTGYYRNLIVGNYTPDGMTGIQLWISCMENIAAGNSIARMRRPAFYLYSNGTTLASSMPRTWNRGLSPLFFNHIEGNRSEECSAGALVTSGDDPKLPIEFPRALGNVLRHNSFIRNRTDGVIIVSRKGQAAQGDTSPSILGTIVEYNVVRDAPIAFHSSHGSDGVVFWSNHAYFWYPVSNSDEPCVGFQVDEPDASVSLEGNVVEGKVGEMKPIGVIEVKKAE